MVSISVPAEEWHSYGLTKAIDLHLFPSEAEEGDWVHGEGWMVLMALLDSLFGT